MRLFIVSLLFAAAVNLASADTPANCTHQQLLGNWNFHFTEGGGDRNIDCSKPGKFVETIPFRLHGRREVTKLSDGQTGNFNLIYNQGFEVEVGFRKMFAFFKYKS